MDRAEKERECDALLKYEPTCGDGNCLFHAVFRQLQRALDRRWSLAQADESRFPADEKALRVQLAAIAGPDERAGYAIDDRGAITDYETFERFAGEFKLGGEGNTWALRALAHRYLSNAAVVVLVWGEGPEPTARVFTGSDRVRFVMPVRLIGGRHYVSLRWGPHPSGLITTDADMHRLEQIAPMTEAPDRFTGRPLVARLRPTVDPLQQPATIHCGHRDLDEAFLPRTVRWDRWELDTHRQLARVELGTTVDERWWWVTRACMDTVARFSPHPMALRPAMAGATMEALLTPVGGVVPVVASSGRCLNDVRFGYGGLLRLLGADPRVECPSSTEALRLRGHPVHRAALEHVARAMNAVVVTVHAETGLWSLYPRGPRLQPGWVALPDDVPATDVDVILIDYVPVDETNPGRWTAGDTARLRAYGTLRAVHDAHRDSGGPRI